MDVPAAAAQGHSYLVDIQIFPEEGALLRGRLPAAVGQDLPKGCDSILRFVECEGLTADGEVDVVLCQRPAPLLVHLHGLTVATQGMFPLKAAVGVTTPV